MTSRKPLPTIWLFTDPRIGEAKLLSAAQRLHSGSAIVLRHYQAEKRDRLRLARKLHRIARRRGHRLFIAGDVGPELRRLADGVHNGRRSARKPLTLPVHDRRELARAKRAGADALFISPVFATRSHRGARPLGAMGFRALAVQAQPMRVYALGGMDARRAAMFDARWCDGFGAIDALIG